MKYLEKINSSSDVKNFIWYSRVTKQQGSFKLNFAGKIKKMKSNKSVDIVINNDSIEIHNNEVFSTQFIASKSLRASLLRWAANLKYFGYRVIGELKNTNDVYKTKQNKFYNRRFIVGAGNEGYIEVVGKNLIKTIINGQTEEAIVMHKKHKLSTRMIPPPKGNWLPTVIKVDKSGKIIYNNNVLPIHRDLELKDFEVMFIEMLKSKYTIKDIKIENLGMIKNRLIFNDLGKSISKFNKDEYMNVEWTKSMLRASFYIVKNQNNPSAMKKKKSSYDDIELINNIEFRDFQNRILSKSGITIDKKRVLSHKIISKLYNTVYSNRTYSDNGPAHVGAVIFDDNDNIFHSERNAPWPNGSRPEKRNDHAEVIALEKLGKNSKGNLSILITKYPCIEYCKNIVQKHPAIKNIYLIFDVPTDSKTILYKGKNVFLLDRDKLDKKSLKLVKRMTKKYKEHLNHK